MSVFKIHSRPLQCGSTVTQSIGLQSCVQFYPAVLKFSPNPTLGWHIEYYAGSVDGAKLVRYRVRLNLIKRRYRLMSEFYEYAHGLVAEINSALKQGWIPNHDDLTSLKGTPVGSVPKSLMTMPTRYVPTETVPTEEQTSTHVYVSMINELQKEVSALKEIIASSSATPSPVVEQTIQEQPVEVEFVPSVPAEIKPSKQESSDDGITLVELIDRFIAAKENNVRKDTMRSYNNNAKLFKAYLNEFLPGIKAQDFSRSDAQAYLAYRDEEAHKVKSKRGDQTDMSTRTTNNHIKNHRPFFAWGIEEELITNNPFAQLKLQRNEEKRRDLVTDDALAKIKEYLTTYNQKGFFTCLYAGL